MALSVGEVQSRAGAEAGIQEPPPHHLPPDTHNTPEEGKKMFEVHKHLCSLLFQSRISWAIPPLLKLSYSVVATTLQPEKTS